MRLWNDAFDEEILLAISVENPVERYPAVPRPASVDANVVSRYEVLTNRDKLAVLTRLARFAVEVKFAKLAVLTTPPIVMFPPVEIYPAVPRPITVDVRSFTRASVVVFNCRFPFVTASRFLTLVAVSIKVMVEVSTFAVLKKMVEK
jgi:hypothetical protein